MKLLITGAGGDIADALCRIARETWPAAEVHGSEIVADPWPLANGFAKLHLLPRADAPVYLGELEALQQRERYSAIVPVTDAELWTLSGADTPPLPLIMAGPETVRRALDKGETSSWLAASGMPALHTVPLRDAKSSDLPVIVKPRRGHGSRGLEIVRTSERLVEVRHERTDDAIAQQYVGSAEEEFTCCVFRRRRTNAVRTLTFRRTLQGGLTGRATLEVVPAIEDLLHQIARAADLDGSINVQLRLHGGTPLVFEINPRFSSTVMMRHLLGFSDFVWAVQGKLEGKEPAAWTPRAGTRVFRLSRELVIPPADGTP